MTDKKKGKKNEMRTNKDKKNVHAKKYIFKACRMGPYKKKCDMVHLLCIANRKKKEKMNQKKSIKRENL